MEGGRPAAAVPVVFPREESAPGRESSPAIRADKAFLAEPYCKVVQPFKSVLCFFAERTHPDLKPPRWVSVIHLRIADLHWSDRRRWLPIALWQHGQRPRVYRSASPPCMCRTPH